MAEMRRKKRRSSNDFLWVPIILLIICLGVLGRQEYKIYQINKEMSATQQRVDELKKVQAELEAERKRLDDLKYIEKLAREDHNMVGKNEVPLFIVDEQEKQQKQETEAEEKKK
jgi:cell division protein DivIC